MKNKNANVRSKRFGHWRTNICSFFVKICGLLQYETLFVRLERVVKLFYEKFNITRNFFLRGTQEIEKISMKNISFSLFVAALCGVAMMSFTLETAPSKRLADPFAPERAATVNTYTATLPARSVALDTVPLKDRPTDFTNKNGKNPFDLNDPSSIDKSVE